MSKAKKLAASLAIAAMAAGCGIIEHQPYPYKTSTKNPALGAWELVQTRMNSKFMPLYRVKTEEPNNILFVGKKQACHLSLYQNRWPETRSSVAGGCFGTPYRQSAKSGVGRSSTERSCASHS